MNRFYHIDGYVIKVRLAPRTVHLRANAALRQMVRRSWKHVEKLCAEILRDYEALYGRPLKIRINSLIVEILGHVYAYQLLLGVRKICSWKLFRMLSLRACSVDCGDDRNDSNRWFWDLLGYGKPLLFAVAA